MTGGKQIVRGRRDLPSKGPASSSGSEDGDQSFSLEEKECLNAKTYLLSVTDSNQASSIYEHLSKLITEILSSNPERPLEHFEEISEALKRERTDIPPTLSLREHVPVTPAQKLAHAQWDLLKRSPRPSTVQQHIEEPEANEEAETGIKFRGVPDIMRQALYFEMAGVGLPREEFFRISLALSELVEANPSMLNIRFWGKILGTVRNYYVAETELGEVDYPNEENENETEHEDFVGDSREEDSSLFDDIILPEDLKPMYKPPPKIPCEQAGTGLNRKVYFVTSDPGLPWTRLPHVTPAQIQVARKIRKFFTGELDHQVVTHPPFPGLEKNYLRAQIARIGASTQISPLGYFRFDDEGEEEEETGLEESGGGRGNMIADSEFEGIAIRDLGDMGLQSWVHHAPAILPQGRTTWWNPVQQKDDYNEEEEDEDEEERQEPDEPEPEVGPPLLSPLAEDDNVGMSPPWVASTSSKFVPEYGIAVLQSNVWPGAATFGTERGRFFENTYVGWGLKNLESSFEPALPEMPLGEFPSGPEIAEADDPTAEEEAAMKAALQEKELEAEFEQQIRDEDDDFEGE